MKIIMVAAISEDCFLTRGKNPNPGDWTSMQDKIHYRNLLHVNDLYLMGSKTYHFAQHSLPANAYKIVMSHNAAEQPKVPNTTFTDKSFKRVIKEFEGKNDQMLVLGGASIFHQMLEQKLIDEAYITIEPILHHTGVQLCTHSTYFEDMGFTLADKKQLNDNGTILKHYILKK